MGGSGIRGRSGAAIWTLITRTCRTLFFYSPVAPSLPRRAPRFDSEDDISPTGNPKIKPNELDRRNLFSIYLGTTGRSHQCMWIERWHKWLLNLIPCPPLYHIGVVLKCYHGPFLNDLNFFLNDCYHGPAEEFVLDSVNIVCILASVNIVY